MGEFVRIGRGSLVRTILGLLTVAGYLGTGYVAARAVSILQHAEPLPTNPVGLLNAPPESVIGPVFLFGAVLLGHFTAGLGSLTLSVGGGHLLSALPSPTFSDDQRRRLRFGGAVFVVLPLLAGAFAVAPVVVGPRIGGLAGVLGVIVIVVCYVLGAGYLGSVLVPPLSSTAAIATVFGTVPGLLVADFAFHRLVAGTALPDTGVALVADLVVLTGLLGTLARSVPAIRDDAGVWAVYAGTVWIVVAAWSLAGGVAPSLPSLFGVLAVVCLLPVMLVARGLVE